MKRSAANYRSAYSGGKGHGGTLQIVSVRTPRIECGLTRIVIEISAKLQADRPLLRDRSTTSDLDLFDAGEGPLRRLAP